MGIKDQIHDSEHYQSEREGDTSTSAVAAAEAATGTGQNQPGVQVQLGPVLDWEKTDVEFWTQVAQLVVLLLIYRELRGA